MGVEKDLVSLPTILRGVIPAITIPLFQDEGIWQSVIQPLLLVGEPRPKFGKLQGRGAIKGLKADSYVKQPAGSESGLRL